MPIADRDLATNYLRYWYNASNVSKLVSPAYVSYPAFIATIDTGGFLSSLGSAMATVRSDKVQAAFEKLAADQPDVVPIKSDFFNYLAAQVGNFTVGDAASAAAEGAGNAVKAAGVIGGLALGGYALYLALGAALIILPMLSQARKQARGVM